MRAALIFEDDKGLTHHFDIVVTEEGLPTNAQAAATRLRESKALRKPTTLGFQVTNETVVGSGSVVPA